MRKALALVVVVLSLLAHNGGYVATAQSGPFMLYGPTSQSCGAFTNASEAERQIYDWWLFGFVSGVGWARGGELASTDAGGIKAWAAKYCAEHPLETFAKAGIDLVTELSKRR
jgi:hypothetical protein